MLIEEIPDEIIHNEIFILYPTAKIKQRTVKIFLISVQFYVDKKLFLSIYH